LTTPPWLKYQGPSGVTKCHMAYHFVQKGEKSDKLCMQGSSPVFHTYTVMPSSKRYGTNVIVCKADYSPIPSNARCFIYLKLVSPAGFIYVITGINFHLLVTQVGYLMENGVYGLSLIHPLLESHRDLLPGSNKILEEFANLIEQILSGALDLNTATHVGEGSVVQVQVELSHTNKEILSNIVLDILELKECFAGDYK
jgi:hypothetical protein